MYNARLGVAYQSLQSVSFYMFQLKVVSLRFFTLLWAILLLIACSSGDKDDQTEQAFSVEFSITDFELFAGESATLGYIINKTEEFSVRVTIEGELGEHSIVHNADEQSFVFQAGNTASSGSIKLTFQSGTHNVEQVIRFVVNANPVPDDSDSSGGDDCPNDNSECPTSEPAQIYKIYLPTDYITIFEGETLTLDLKRNYEMSEAIVEQFYFNSPLISGRVSNDKQQLIIEALEGESDTYGEILAVTKVAGVETTTRMQLIYFNKNRDLTTTEAPVIALLQQSIELQPFTSKTINFDVYDPDSDRISYRVLSAPMWLESHINKAKAGFDLTFYPVADIDEGDNKLVLEVSDAHNTDQFTFNLVEKAVGNRTDPEQGTIPARPRLLLETNVNLSLLKKLTGAETDQIAQLAFAYSDRDSEHVDLSVASSSQAMTLKLSYPYIYVHSDDVSALQYEQITVTADDGQFESKMTFHLYIKDNFTSFFGGNPNLAPLIAIDDPITVLETKSATVSYQLSDFEQHDFDAEIAFDEQHIHAILNEGNIELAALPIEGDEDISTEITLSAIDVFGSRREQTIKVNIEKNTPPDISFSKDGEPFESIHLVEGFKVTFDVIVNDINEGTLTPEFSFNTNKLHVNYQNGELTLTALDIVEDFDGEFTVSATDEFGATTEASLPLEISFTNTAPVISADFAEIEILPGETIELNLSYVDPEADEMSINRVVDSGNLDFSYNEATNVLTLTVGEDADFEDVYHFTTTATDGFLDSEFILTVRVPDEPVAPVIAVEPYFTNVNEGSTFIINFAATDDNGDDVSLSLNGGDLADLSVTLLDSDDEDTLFDHIEVVVPDNVLVDTNYSFNLNAVDNSASILTDVVTIDFTVMPVNDVPQVVLSQDTITMINDDQFSLPITITDPDDTIHTVEVRAINSAVVPSDIVVHATSNNAIVLSGASKGTIVNNLPLVVRVYDSQAFSDVSLTVNVELDNQAPIFDPNMVGLVQLPANSTETFNITPTDPDSATDGDVVTVVSVVSDDPSSVEIVGDPNNPALNTVTFNTLNVAGDTRAFITITITDGFETVIERVQVHIP